MRALLTWLLVCSVGISSAQSPVVRAKLVPASGVIVGQPVHLIVEVMVPNFFTGSPDFPTFELDNAIVVLPEETPQNFNERINGQTFAGIRRTYFLYPQQPGDFRLPPALFTVPYAKNPPQTTQAKLTLPHLTFHADIPLAAQGLSYFLPTTQLTMQQHWNSPLNKLRVGDTVERTITVTTTKMQGMLIPPLPLDAPPGIRIYPEEPKVIDQKTERGEFVFGRRTQSAKYFIQKVGDYNLPAIELKWWNLNSNRLVTATIPATRFTAAPNPDYVAELPPESEVVAVPPKTTSLRSRYRPILTAAALLSATLLVLWLLYRYFPRLMFFFKAKREHYLHSEPAYFRNLTRACRRNDAHDSYQWLLRWLDRSGSGKSLSSFLEQSDDEELTQHTNALTSNLFAKVPSGSWNGQIMANHLRKHRKLSFARRQQGQLPSLNPD
jgi:hypothetical protein